MPQETLLKREHMKEAIRLVVNQYKELFPAEFGAFCRGQRLKLSMQADDFGTMRGSDIIERAIHEMPETLWTAMQRKLSPFTIEWFRTKEGARWFAREFPAFKSAEKI